MKLSLKPLTTAVLIAGAQFSGVAFAQSTKTPAAQAAPHAVVGKVSVAGIANGKIKTKADPDKASDKLTEEPQRHFDGAIEAFASKHYKAAATEIRKATDYLRREAGRVKGDARQALDSSVAELGKLAASVEKGAIKDEKAMDKAFAKADHALALAHRTQAAESWARKEYNEAGHELKAAADGLESAAGWAGAEAKAGASGAVADTKALGDKLATGATWTRDEVGRGFDTLGHALNQLGHEIGAKQQATPVKSSP